MRIKQMRIGIKRSIRHAPYVMSEPEVELTGLIEVGENVPAAVEELEGDVQILLDRICETEIEKYEVRKNANKNKRRKR